jgi:nucleotide-binding universal stress UspA family protein
MMLPKIKKILCAVDLNDHAKITFRYAMGLAQQYQAKVILLHVIEPLNDIGIAMLETYISQIEVQQLHQQALETVRKNIQQRLDDFYQEESQHISNAAQWFEKILILEGAPAKIIIEQSINNQVDMIVMGTHYHSMIGEIFVGSTMRRVTHLSKIPVLIVPSFNQT